MGGLHPQAANRSADPAGTPYEIATVYTEAHIQAIDYAQSETGMYLFHGEVYPHILKQFDEENWDCSNAPFSAIPFEETGDYPAAAVTLSLATVGTGRTATAAAASFLVSDIGRAIIWKTGIGVITAFTSTTVVTIQIVTAFSDVSIGPTRFNVGPTPPRFPDGGSARHSRKKRLLKLQVCLG
jgi:hypothetical protein